MTAIMGNKSTLRALEPVEIRLASVVRVRREIERLRAIERTLEQDARSIATSVLGANPDVVEVVLGVIQGPLDLDPEGFDQQAVATFLADQHGLSFGGQPVAASEPEGVAGSSPVAQPAPAPFEAGPALAPTVPAAAPQVPSEAPVVPSTPAAAEAPSAPAHVAAAPSSSPPASHEADQPDAAATFEAQHASPPQAAVSQQASGGQAPNALAERLAAYDVLMPDDYFGVGFDMLKKPEADTILAEAALSVAEGVPLDDSPYKADRGKVHWRRRLFEEAYGHFQANPPQARFPLPEDGPDHAQVRSASADTPEAPALPVHGPETVETADQPIPDSVLRLPETAAVQEPSSTALGLEGRPGIPVEPAFAGAEVRQFASGEGVTKPVDDAQAPSFETAPLAAAATDQHRTAQILDFRGSSPAGGDAGPIGADDIVDVFGQEPAPSVQFPALDERQLADTSEDEENGAESSAGDGPEYDGPEWDGPIDDLDHRFGEAMMRDEPSLEAPAPQIDGAAAAALAEAASLVPPPPVVPSQSLPATGVPPRPTTLLSSLRPAPALPTGASMPPMPIARAAPPLPPQGGVAPMPIAAPAPTLVPGGVSQQAAAGRVPPRAVSVRPPA